MNRPVSRLTAKAQTTVPKDVREALGLKPGDGIAYEIQDGQAIIRKASNDRQAYLEMLNNMFEEWMSPEDDEAFAYLSKDPKKRR
jgi:antitoxin PrlF